MVNRPAPFTGHISRRGAALFASAMMLASAAAACGQTGGTHSAPGALPADAVGVVTISPSVLPIPRGAHMQVVAFSSAGNPVWELDQSAVDAPRMVAWDRGFAVGTGTAVVSVSPSTRAQVPVTENMSGGATVNEQTGSSTFWYNSGTPSGSSGEYRNNYVSLDRGGHSHNNFVPGYMSTAAKCKESTFGVSSPFSEFNGNADRLNELYELPDDGGRPRLYSSWRINASLRPEDSLCAPQNNAVYIIHRDLSGSNGLQLLRFDTATKEMSLHPITLPVGDNAVRKGTFTLVGDKLMWVAVYGEVFSVPVNGPYTAKQEWVLPVGGPSKSQVSVVNGTVAALDARVDPEYTEYDLQTGKIVRNTVPLPWLKGRMDQIADGDVTGVTSIPSSKQ